MLKYPPQKKKIKKNKGRVTVVIGAVSQKT